MWNGKEKWIYVLTFNGNETHGSWVQHQTDTNAGIIRRVPYLESITISSYTHETDAWDLEIIEIPSMPSKGIKCFPKKLNFPKFSRNQIKRNVVSVAVEWIIITKFS